MATIVEHLRMLRDVHGVYGSFVVAESGSLVDRDLPAAFDDALFDDVGPRVARLFETFVSGGKDMETCMIRYAEHKLYIRKMSWGILAIVSSAAVNMPAMRMVANLVARRIDPEIVPLTSMRPFSSRPLPVAASPVTVKAMSPAAPVAPHRQESPELAASGAVTPVDGRDATAPVNDRHIRIYRGRPVSR